MRMSGLHACLAFAGLVGMAGASAAPATPARNDPAPALARPVAANPALSGFCLFARGTAIQQSRAGAAARQRMAGLEEGVAADLRRQRALLDIADRTLAGQQATLPPAQFQSRVAELKARLAAIEQARATAVTRIKRTRAAAQRRIDTALDPLLATLFAEHGCIVLMERNNAYIYANQLDLTAEIVRRLDTALPPFAMPLLPAG